MGWTERSVWVLDGATGLSPDRLLPGPSDAAWFVQEMDSAFRELDPDPTPDLRERIERAIRIVADRFVRFAVRPARERYELPSASMAFLRLEGTQAVCAVLGDCRMLVEGQGRPPLELGGGPLEALDRRVLEEVRRSRESGSAEPHQASAVALPLLREHRAKMNTPEGYWALSLDVSAAAHLSLARVDLQPSAGALLASDGFYRLVDTFHAFGPEDLLREVRVRGLEKSFERLRMLEAQDPECRTFPRFKMSDDATAVVVSFQ
ncbi:MAG: hypothetical protein HYZ53_16845 [Planctomycetes bacterium]|nr:hypothetical protein [Planctomycetota bacterium]